MASAEGSPEFTPLVNDEGGRASEAADSRRDLRCLSAQGAQAPPSSPLQRLRSATPVLAMIGAAALLAAFSWGHIQNSWASRQSAVNSDANQQHLLRRPRSGASSGDAISDSSIEMKEVIFKNSTAAPEASGDAVLERAAEKEKKKHERAEDDAEAKPEGDTTEAPATTKAPAATKASTTTKAPTTTLATTTTEALPHFVPLFCWALITPWGYEKGLVTSQHSLKAGIFACDDWAVYSNETLDFGGAFKNKLVYTSLRAVVGGQWNTLLNTPIFLAAWKQVVKDGQFWHAEWTVKVDADAVFFPERLAGLLKAPGHEHPQWGNGMFADNCGYTHSMHGPIEVFSRRAIVVWMERAEKECKQPPQEDVYMRECMIQLGVTELHEWNLLAEQSCFWDWWNCQTMHVAFHPFKKLDDWKGCLDRAKHPTPPPPR